MNLVPSLKNAEIQPSEFPKLIWRYYVHYLVNYQQKSWVGRIAYVFRILAAMAAIPFLILMLLDIATYVVARTLGTMDGLRPPVATTEQPATAHPPTAPPFVVVKRPSESDSISSLSSQSVDTPSRPLARDVNKTLLRRRAGGGRVSGEEAAAAAALDASHPQEYFTSEGGNLKLSGVGVFSPAASQPPSPTTLRHPLSMDGRWEGFDKEGVDEGLLMSRRHPRQAVESGM